MSRLIYLCFPLFSSLFLFAQDAETLVQEARNLESSLHESAAFEKLKQALKVDPRNFFALWKCSELCSRIGNRQTTKQKKQDYFEAARIYAETAIKIRPGEADGYYALAVAMGRRAMIETGKEKVKAVKEIKLNAEKAIQINPNHGRAWHVIGKWHYEVSNLNPIEKAALKLLYGGIPHSSLQEAINAYERASQLEPYFALNYLELAKAYHRDDQDDKAIEQLKKIPALPAKTEDDPRIHKEAKELLDKIYASR
jgi:tetratricopeptide (TPR) repeat protein